MKIEIKHRFDGAVLFSLETESLKLCVEAAVKSGAYLRGAYLRGAYLGGAYLGGADLRGAYLSGANLGGADLGGAYLGGADLSGAYLGGVDLSGVDLSGANFGTPPATPEEAIKNLDTVAEIILSDTKRLYMDHWHEDGSWTERTCAEEAVCGTTHCLAGWLQVCATNPDVRKLVPNVAGAIQAPVAAKMFYETNDRVIEWLKNREYAEAA